MDVADAYLTLIGGADAVTKRDTARQSSDFNKLPNHNWHWPGSPKFMGDKPPVDILTELGFKCGKNIDKYFFEVTPPQGWKLRLTEHYMYSRLVDDKGRDRGQQGYKGGYDLWVSFNLYSRYHIGSEYKDDHESFRYVAKDRATGEIIAEQPWYTKPDKDDRKAYMEYVHSHDEIVKDHCEALTRILDEKFPGWQSPIKYW